MEPTIQTLLLVIIYDNRQCPNFLFIGVQTEEIVIGVKTVGSIPDSDAPNDCQRVVSKLGIEVTWIGFDPLLERLLVRPANCSEATLISG